ncbi:hypothetical protein SGLAM104S_05939 [Streptomyces glaucescens]
MIAVLPPLENATEVTVRVWLQACRSDQLRQQLTFSECNDHRPTRRALPALRRTASTAGGHSAGMASRIALAVTAGS